MFYVRMMDGRLEYRPVSPYMGTAWYERYGWMLYSGSLPQSRVAITGGTQGDDGITRGGTITELPEPEASGAEAAFKEIKTAFWAYVDGAAEALGKTRADFPTGLYSTELLQWCSDNGLDSSMTDNLAIKFCGISSDLTRIGYNWNDLFDEVAEGSES